MIQLRWYQDAALNSIFEYFRKVKGKLNPLVVAPTGSGKSFIIAGFCQHVRETWPEQRILILSHVKEILSQDLKAIKEFLPDENIGIWSAGLKSKDIKPITIASIQSAYNNIKTFQENFDIVLVDECHLIPHRGQGRYRTLLKALGKPTVGFTATPFRLGTGYLHIGEGSLFDQICYNITIKQLIEEGHLCKVTAKAPKERMDPEGIKKSGGDYVVKDLALRFDREEITRRIIDELVLYKNTRKKWLLFAVNIAHAEHIAALLCGAGVWAEAVHSKTKNRTKILNQFKDNPLLQALVSVAVLTTGFDAPAVDLVGLLRPTSSPVLHVQIIGRGLRPFPGKENCLVLDFAGNLIRNGPIDAPQIRVAYGDGTGEPVMKECPECFEIVHAAVKICPCCNHEFQFQHNLNMEASGGSVLSEPEWFDVISVGYSEYFSKSGKWMLRVSYNCGVTTFNEYIAVEHGGYARYRAQHWWARRHEMPLPETAKEAYDISKTLVAPNRILVDYNGKYPEIKKQEF